MGKPQSFFLFRPPLQSAILNFMRFTSLVPTLVMSLSFDAETIQGKVVRVSDGDTITILDEVKVQHNARGTCVSLCKI